MGWVRTLLVERGLISQLVEADGALFAVRRSVGRRSTQCSKDVDAMTAEAGRDSTVEGSSDGAGHSKPSIQRHASEDVRKKGRLRSQNYTSGKL